MIMKVLKDAVVILLSFLWCFLFSLFDTRHIVAAKAERNHADLFRGIPVPTPSTPPAYQPPAPVQGYSSREVHVNHESRSSLLLNEKIKKGQDKESELKEYRSLLDTLLNALERDNDLQTDSEDNLEDLSNRNIEVPQTYGVNLGAIGHLHYNGKLRSGEATDTHSCNNIRKVPSLLRYKSEMWPEGIQSHYTKYTEAYGIPIIGSSKVTNEGLQRACYIVRLLFADRYDIRNAYFKLYGRVALIANGEETTDLPDYSHMDPFWDIRSRGLGALVDNPTSSAGDDNVRCCCGDRYPEEDILVHELAHGAHLIGAAYVVPGFAVKLVDAYTNAMSKGLWKDDYAATNYKEYWAVGATYYFNTRGWYKLKKPNGVAVKGDGQNVLAGYDPTLLALLKEVFPCNNKLISRCAYKACTNNDFNKLEDKSAGKSLAGCSYIDIETDVSLSDCFQLTCIRDGNAMNFMSGECQILQCSSISYTTSRGGYHVYKLKETTTLLMTLTEESSAVLSTNCIERDPTLSGRCDSVSTQIYHGNVNKATCKLRGYCYSGGKCYYPDQDCMDTILECNLAADTCGTNSYFMLTRCPLTCGVCQYAKHINKAAANKFCHDENLNCKQWATSGECEKNPGYMNSACPLSCNICNKQAPCNAVAKTDRVTCDADSEEMCYMKGCCWKSGSCFYPSDCSDKSDECQVAASLGECERNPNYMKVECPLSCGSCQDSASIYTHPSEDAETSVL